MNQQQPASLKMRMPWILAAFFILASGAFLDCARGPLLPWLKEAFALSYQESSQFLVYAYGAAIFATLALIPILNTMSEKKVGIGTCLIGLITIASSFFIDSFSGLLTFGVLLGVVISTVGTLCNIFIVRGSPPALRARYLCGLHIMYAASALLCPSIVGLGQKYEWNWPWVLGGLPALSFLFVIFNLRKTQSTEAGLTQAKQSAKLSRMQVLIIIAFATYVAGEVLTSMWMVTYLVEERFLSLNQAGHYLTGFFAIMCLTRFICMLSLKPNQEKMVIRVSLIAASCFFIIGHSGNLWGFALTGVLGPFFPLVLSRISHNFPTQWRSMTVWILVAVQISLAICHFSVGRLFDSVGIGYAYTGPAILIVLALILISIYFEWEKRLVEKPN